MGNRVPPQGALRMHSNPSFEMMMKFIQAFGAGALSPPPIEQRHAVEALLARLTGVHSARVETTATGEIERIHVVADGTFPPAEQKRHIRSALLAAHDLEIDPRLISLVALREKAGYREEVQHPSVLEPRARLNQISYQQEGFRITAHVELDWQSRTFHGLSQDADTAKGRIMAAGRAALKALEKVTDRRVAFFLEAIDTLHVFTRNVMVASVRVVSDLCRADLVGCASSREDPNYAAAQAVLSAVNRSFVRLIVSPRSIEADDIEAEE